MKLNREWVTPLATGAFLLSAVTGVLLFFKIDVGLSKLVHEWLSWLLLGGAVLHVIANINAFMYHLSTRTGQVVIGLSALVLVASLLVSTGGQSEPPFIAPMRALSQLPLSTLAEVAQVSPQELRERLSRAGVASASDTQSLNDLLGNDLRKQMPILGALFSPQK